MSNAWFRLYHEFSADPKVQMLSEADQRRYIMLLCMRCRESRPLKNAEIAFHLHIGLKRWERTRKIFIGNQLINDDNSPINWDKRQFASDFSAPRVASHRAKKKGFDNNADPTYGNDDVTLHDRYGNGGGNGDGNGDAPLLKRRSNALDTDTDTDTEKEEEKENPPTPLKGGGAGVDADASCSRSDTAVESWKSSSKHRASGSKSVPEGFDEFYASYPRHEARRDAERAWQKLAPDEALRIQIHAALDTQKQSQQWRKDNGSFVPLPASWLNGRRWEDQPPPDRPGGSSEFVVDAMMRVAL